MTDTTTTPATSLPSTAAARRWRTEDWIAVVLGFLVIAAVLLTFQWKVADLRSIVPSFRWTTDVQIASMIPRWTGALDIVRADALANGQQNVLTLSDGLKQALVTQDRTAIDKAAAPLAALGSRSLGGALGTEIRAHATASAQARVFTADNLTKVATVGIGFLIVTAIGVALLGGRVSAFVIGLPAIFGLAWLARLLAGNGLFVDWGIEYVIFSLALGLLI